MFSAPFIVNREPSAIASRLNNLGNSRILL